MKIGIAFLITSALGIASVTAGSVVWAYATFAQKEVVIQMRDDIKDIRDKVYIINGERPPSRDPNGPHSN